MDDRSAARALTVLDRYQDAPKHPRGYADLHEHVLALARAGLLVVVDEPINKDTEMHPLVRWQYRGGIPEPERKAFLFTQPTDSKGRRFDIAVLVAGLAATARSIASASASRSTRSAAPGSGDRQPGRAARGHRGALPGGGDQRRRPRPRRGRRSTACRCRSRRRAWDNAPYLSAGPLHHQGSRHRHPERRQLPRPDQGAAPARHEPLGRAARRHLRPLGEVQGARRALPCAVVVGCPPVISYASVQKMPDNLDELAVAGALAGGPDQRGAGQDRRSAGAGRGRDRHRGPDRHRTCSSRRRRSANRTATSTCRNTTPSWT